MSAWLVSEFHINALVTWGANNGVTLPRNTREEVTRLLTDENMKSLNARYGDDTKEWAESAATYTYKNVCDEDIKTFVKQRNAKDNKRHPRYAQELPPITKAVLATQIAKACDCYHYQACEHDGYENSEARAFVQDVLHAALDAGAKGGGKTYDALLWGLD